MELIVISESKLKIMLTAPDMAHYELAGGRMDCADSHTRAAFRHIFDDARAESGFDTEGERLLVQLYASREGGCEIFVTKLGERGGATDAEDALLRCIRGEHAAEEARMADESGRLAERSHAAAGVRRAAVVFGRLEDLLAVCRRLRREGYRGQSDWYLILEVPDTPFFRLPIRFSFLTEYGEEAPLAGLEDYLSEHADVICLHTAVNVMGDM